MYYGDCTPAYAVEVIKEIIDNAAGDLSALSMVRNFMDGTLSTDEIADMF